MSLYVGVGSEAKTVTKLYLGVDGVAKTIKKVYCGKDGIATKVWPYEVRTLTVVPSGYTNNSFKSISDINNAYTNCSSDTYASLYFETGSGVWSTIFLTFDCSSLPDDAILQNVEIKTKMRVSTTSTSYLAEKEAQAYINGSLEGTPMYPTTTVTTFTAADIPTTLTVADYKSGFAIKYVGKRGTSSTSTSRIFRIYGAEATFTYLY